MAINESIEQINTNTGLIEEQFGQEEGSLQRLSTLPEDGAITSESLAEQPSADFQTFEEPPVDASSAFSSLDFSSSTQAPQETLGPEGERIQSEINNLIGLNEQTLGESAFRTAQEDQFGLPGMMQQQQELSARLGALKNEALAIPLQLQQDVAGRGVTKGGLRPIETGKLRNNAIQALTTSSLLEATRGNIGLATQMIDRAVAAKFDPIKEQIRVKQQNIELIKNSPAFNLEQKNKAIEMEFELRAREAALNAEADQMKNINNFAVQAAQRGATGEQLARIQNARTEGEALQFAAEFLGKDFSEKMKNDAFDRQLKEANYNLSVDKFNQDIYEFGEKMALDRYKLSLTQQEKAIANAEKKNEKDLANQLKATALQSQLDTLSNIFTRDESGNIVPADGLDSRVGTTRAGRRSFAIADKFSGEGQEFAGYVHKLVGQETLNTLVNLKAQGGTLGALSDTELELLRNSASAINDWEIKKDGEAIGEWNISEDAFLKEMQTIEGLINTAMARATGAEPLTDEDSFYISSTLNPDETVLEFDPSLY